MVERLNIEDVMDLSELDKRTIQSKQLFGDSRFEKKDVYAISKHPEDPNTKTYFEIRKHMDTNDQLMATKAYDQVKSVVKLVECGTPLYKIGRVKTPEPTNFLVGKDVYALVDNPEDEYSRLFWEVRNHNENNDDKVIEQANSWGRNVVKVMEDGEPLLPGATKEDLASIPISSQRRYDFPDIIPETFREVQGGLNLDEYNLQQSVDELSDSQTDEMNL